MTSVETQASSTKNRRAEQLRQEGQQLVPKVTPWLLKGFVKYCHYYLKKNFHSLRVSKQGRPPSCDEQPLIVFANHPSWWDPLICFLLAQQAFPEKKLYAPIDAEMLEKYRIFKKLGLFGVERNTRRGAVTFLKVSLAALDQPNASLWITPTGEFTDPRQRPLKFEPGLGHLATKLERGLLLPLSVEYTFWNERFPEILLRFGEPIQIADYPARTAEAWTSVLEESLTETMDALAEEVIARDGTLFEPLLKGSVGVGGIYDCWRWLTAKLQGKEFRRSHGDDAL